jgi:hypothetical protein
MSKKWYQSKTMWFNLLVASMLLIEQNINFLQPLLPINLYALLSFIVPLVNMWLRVITSQGIKQ